MKKALYHCEEAVLVHYSSNVLLTRIWPCCTPILHLPSATWCLSSFLRQPWCSQLARRGRSLFSPLVPVAQNLGCSEQPPAATQTLSFSWYCSPSLSVCEAASFWLRWGRAETLRSLRGRKSVSLHSADTILFFKRKLWSLCILVSLGTSHHTSDPGPPTCRKQQLS